MIYMHYLIRTLLGTQIWFKSYFTLQTRELRLLTYWSSYAFVQSLIPKPHTQGHFSKKSYRRHNHGAKGIPALSHSPTHTLVKVPSEVGLKDVVWMKRIREWGFGWRGGWYGVRWRKERKKGLNRMASLFWFVWDFSGVSPVKFLLCPRQTRITSRSPF